MNKNSVNLKIYICMLDLCLQNHTTDLPTCHTSDILFTSYLENIVPVIQIG